MGAQSKGKPRKFKQQGKFKKEKFGSANDVPLGPRMKFGVTPGGSDEIVQVKSNEKVNSGKKEKWNISKGKGDKNKRNEEIVFNPKNKKSIEEKKEVGRLNRILENGPHLEPAQVKTFKDLPLSKKTLMGLEASEYEVPTDIQKEALGLALRGFDILGAAKTGSGKTLAFLIPVIEKLYRSFWSKLDGLGAVIITPTRELAYQIFEALRKIGRYHEFSAGLIIGGKDLKFERKRMDQLNIVICTPGRLLQHMDENPTFITSNVQMLVLDEADRCLDMGFERDMNAILEHLPSERQTLLFSATQTKSVKDLARLSLNSPVYVSVHENSEFSTPEALRQTYVVCPLESKLDMLWSFLKHHRKSKILVFMSSCKQVRFVNMLFCRMRPGISLLALHGAMHQLKRMAVYDDFCKKQAVVLFATDIAARGLDFPAVDWVLQLDCPEDATTYIHRAGRTARFNKDGEALLVLIPSEEDGMLKVLQQKRIPIDKIEVNMKKMMSVTRKFEALLARDVTLKECAQRAFKAYLKSVFLMKNKSVFDVEQLDLPSFARSLGLAVAPRVRFLKKRGIGSKENESKSESSNEDAESEDESQVHNEKIIQPKQSAPTFDFSTADDDEDMDTLFTGKKATTILDDEDEELPEDVQNSLPNNKKKTKTKASVAKKLIKKKIQVNKKVVFDEEGEMVPDARRDKRSDMARSYENEDAPGIDVEKAKQVLKEEDQFDKQMFREKIKARHREERRKAKLARKGFTKEDAEDADEERTCVLKNSNDDSDSEDEYEPNLDWLPDPDKVYGTKGSDDDSADSGNSDHSDFSEDESEEEPSFRGNKRQREVVNTDSESEDEEPIRPIVRNQKQKDKPIRKPATRKAIKLDTDMDKGLMEDLALQLLSGRK